MKRVLILCLVIATLSVAGCHSRQPSATATPVQASVTSSATATQSQADGDASDTATGDKADSDDGDKADAKAGKDGLIVAPDGDIIESPLTTMPVLVGKTLRQAYVGSHMDDYNVWVQFPSVEATWTNHVLGVGNVARQAALPPLMKSLATVRLATHRIVSQVPAPGAPISVDMTVTLVAGPHPGSGSASWGSAHIRAVAKGGDAPCLASCHFQGECTDCHGRYQ